MNGQTEVYKTTLVEAMKKNGIYLCNPLTNEYFAGFESRADAILYSMSMQFTDFSIMEWNVYKNVLV